MGKVKPLIPSEKFCVQTRVNKKGETAIYLKYHLDGYLKRSTGINIPPTAWDDKKCCVKPSYPAASQINLQLQQFKTSIDKRLSEYDGEISRTVLSFILNGGDPTDAGDLPDESATQVANKNTSFVEYAKSVNDLNYGKKEYGYSLWYNKQKLIEHFETFLVHWRKRPKFALKDLRPDMEETVVEKVRYLTPEKIEQLKDYQSKCKNPRSKEILDMWFFAYYACGLRLSDVMTLEWKHIDWEAKVIKKVQFKTKRLPDVLPPLGNSAMEILERWKEKNRNSRFVFDLLAEDYDLTDQKRLFMDRNSKDKTFNTSLNVARMTLRLPFPLTMHVARHSFAVMCINQGMSIFLLSKIMGHATIASTQRTYAQFLKETIEAETRFIRDL